MEKCARPELGDCPVIAGGGVRVVVWPLCQRGSTRLKGALSLRERDGARRIAEGIAKIRIRLGEDAVRFGRGLPRART